MSTFVPIYAVDFDGTLCESQWPGIGAPNMKLIEHLIKRQKEGAKIILWTCRIEERLQEAVDWCAAHGLIFDAVNDNLPENIEKYGNNCRKIYATCYIDDLAVDKGKYGLPYHAEPEPDYSEFDKTVRIAKLKHYEDLEERGLLLKVPEIPKGKTIYWVWADEIMPCIFKRITSCIVDGSPKVHIMCEMRTKKDRTFIGAYKRRKTETTFKAGDTRYFYADEIGKTIFFTKTEAEETLRKGGDKQCSDM